MTNLPTIGRFAPSPSGPLHFGSLLAGVASYCDAKAQGGRWLLRIEDLDPPREPAGTAAIILDQLLAFGLQWDGDVLYQSERLEAYAAALTQLANEGLCFRCECTRADLRAQGNVYSGRCRAQGVSARDLQYGDAHGGRAEAALRVRVGDERIAIVDRVQGHFEQALKEDVGDFVVRRKDGLFAYQLAVVIDDAYQGVTDIVRGIDLLDSTPRQRCLQDYLGLPEPRYAHLPVVVDAAGDKLSKQSFAQAIDPTKASMLLTRCLDFLGQEPSPTLADTNPQEILSWAVSHWDMQRVPKLATLPNA